MRTIALFLLFCFGFCLVCVEAQTKKRGKFATKLPKVNKAKTVKKPFRTISAGVINGKAIDLVKPEYPKSTRVVNVYGQITVQVLVDENGNVISAKVNSGNPLLRSSSVKAAFQSKFKPLILSGEPVRMYGIIHYNFIPSEWNWLEIGYTLSRGSSYYSIKTLLETFPLGYEEEKQLLTQWFEANESQDQIIETVVASISGKLSNNAKAFWLFEVGSSLAKFRQEQNVGGLSANNNSLSVQKLKLLVQNPPSGINERLIQAINELIFNQEEDAGAVNKLQKLEENFPYVGR